MDLHGILNLATPAALAMPIDEDESYHPANDPSARVPSTMPLRPLAPRDAPPPSPSPRGAADARLAWLWDAWRDLIT
jgi:hypothetical protein